MFLKFAWFNLGRFYYVIYYTRQNKLNVIKFKYMASMIFAGCKKKVILS